MDPYHLDHVDLSGPVDPVCPVGLAGPVDLVCLRDPVDPVGLARPECPGNPVGPADLALLGYLRDLAGQAGLRDHMRGTVVDKAEVDKAADTVADIHCYNTVDTTSLL